MPRALNPNRNKGRPSLEEIQEDNELPHKGVAVIGPSPKHGRPCWVMRWIKPGETRRDKKGRLKPTYQPLPAAKDRPDAIAAAARKSVELGLQQLDETEQHLAHVKQLERTLKDELEGYLQAGIKAGKKLGRPYAEPTARNYRKAVESLTAFASSKGCSLRSDGSLYLSEIPRKLELGRSLLWHWKQHESRTNNPGSVMALTKCLHAVLKAARVSDTEYAFDPRLLSGAIPVRFVAPENAPRTLETDELKAILKAALELDTDEELVSADIALLLVTSFRRAEQSFLEVRHCRVNAVPPGYVDQRATWIELPSKISGTQYNHAKGGKARKVLMTKVTPLGTEILSALCYGRGQTEWVTSLSYSRLAARVDTIAAMTGIDFSTKSLRCTAANHNRRLLGKDEAVKRCGHTEGVAVQSYEDDTFASALVLVTHPSLEAAMGIEDELREVLSRVCFHKRGWGAIPRPIPDVFKSEKKGTAAPNTRELKIAG